MSSSSGLKDEGTRTDALVAGGVAGLISRFCIAPLDVVKIRLQLQVHSLTDPLSQKYIRGGPIYKGILGTTRSIFRQEGITAFWKGNIPAELLYVTYGALQFGLYNATTQALQSFSPTAQLPDVAQSFVSGAAAGGLATTATYPLDLLRTRFAAQGSVKIYQNLLAGIRDIAKYEGARGFFQGATAAIGQIVPYMGLFFASYETLRVPLGELPLPVGSSDAVAGVLASVFSKTAVFPLDTIRKRLQVQGPTRQRYIHRNIPRYKGIIGTLRLTLYREGVRGLYRGLPVSLVKAAPASAITMWTYERVLSTLQKVEELVAE